MKRRVCLVQNCSRNTLIILTIFIYLTKYFLEHISITISSLKARTLKSENTEPQTLINHLCDLGKII